MPTYNYPYRTAASVARLCEIKDVTPDDAKKIRRLWKNLPRNRAREEIDRVLRTCGVEFLGYHRRSWNPVYYANAGDTYATTVLFINDRLVVGCWGDLVETDTVRVQF